MIPCRFPTEFLSAFRPAAPRHGLHNAAQMLWEVVAINLLHDLLVGAERSSNLAERHARPHAPPSRRCGAVRAAVQPGRVGARQCLIELINNSDDE